MLILWTRYDLGPFISIFYFTSTRSLNFYGLYRGVFDFKLSKKKTKKKHKFHETFHYAFSKFLKIYVYNDWWSRFPQIY